jgi:hypothetical protein
MIDYSVRNLNDLNRALPRAEKALADAGKRWRKSLRDEDREAISDWAVIIAEDCAAWFDWSAFQ